MNRRASICLIGLVGLVGCTAPTASTNPPPTTHSETGQDGTVTTFVSLKVPNMHWAACCASVRGDLSKIAGVTDIKTDANDRLCTFTVTDENVDYKAEIAKYAETNQHLADYTYN